MFFAYLCIAASIYGSIVGLVGAAIISLLMGIFFRWAFSQIPEQLS